MFNQKRGKTVCLYHFLNLRDRRGSLNVCYLFLFVFLNCFISNSFDSNNLTVLGKGKEKTGELKSLGWK